MNDIDMALEAEVARRAIALGIGTQVGGQPSRVARLVARLYAGADAIQRSRLLAGLLRPLGPLALVAVASGAFAGLFNRVGGDLPANAIEELARFSAAQVFELASFVEQVDPDVLKQVAGRLVDSPLGLSAFGVAAALSIKHALPARSARAS